VPGTFEVIPGGRVLDERAVEIRFAALLLVKTVEGVRTLVVKLAPERGTLLKLEKRGRLRQKLQRLSVT